MSTNRKPNRWEGLGRSSSGNNDVANAAAIAAAQQADTTNNNNNNNIYQPIVQNPNGAAAYDSGVSNVYDGPVGKYLYSQPDLSTPNSVYLKCYYRAEVDGQPEVMRLCEKIEGCCLDDCCPIDYQRLGPLYVLIAFVVIFAILGFIIGIVCYARSKSKARKEQRYYNEGYAASQMGSQMGYPYAPSGYAPSGKY